MDSVYVPNMLDEVFTPLYDTYSVAAATVLPRTISFFTARTSASNGLEVTNMTKSQELPAPQSFDVSALRFVMVGMVLSDIENFFKNYCAQLIVGGKEYLQAPLEYFPGGAGVAGAISVSTTVASTTSTAYSWSNGQPTPKALLPLPDSHVIKIGVGSTFRVELVSTNGFTLAAAGGATLGQGAFVRCYLDGLYRRPVQ